MILFSSVPNPFIASNNRAASLFGSNGEAGTKVGTSYLNYNSKKFLLFLFSTACKQKQNKNKEKKFVFKGSLSLLVQR
jgi:hypothetical protein